MALIIWTLFTAAVAQIVLTGFNGLTLLLIGAIILTGYKHLKA